MLHPPLELALDVVDAAGEPVPDFEVHAVRIVEGALGEMGMTRAERRGARGRCVLAELDDGTWGIRARAPGLSSGTDLRIEWPAACAAGPITLVLQPTAAVAGRVLRADGRPASGATVAVESESEHGASALAPGAAPPRARADETGAFRLEELPAGRVQLVTVTLSPPGPRPVSREDRGHGQAIATRVDARDDRAGPSRAPDVPGAG